MLEPRPLPDYRSDLHPHPAYGLGVMLSAVAPELHPVGHSGEGPGSRIAVYALDDRASAIWSAQLSGTNVEAEAFKMLRRGAGSL
jgi:hypothetical protein